MFFCFLFTLLLFLLLFFFFCCCCLIWGGRGICVFFLFCSCCCFFFIFVLASHCPEVDTRWSYECGILKFARNSSRTWISANQQQKSLGCLPKVTRLHSNTTRRFQEGNTKATRRCDFKYDIYMKALRRSHYAVRRLHSVVFMNTMHSR